MKPWFHRNNYVNSIQKKKKTFNEVFVFNYGEVFILGLLI